MATLFQVEKPLKRVKPVNGKTFTLKELQTYVGGSIEMIFTNIGGRVFVVNEEGKLRNLEINYLATLLYQRVFKCTDFLVGDVLLCSDNEIE